MRKAVTELTKPSLRLHHRPILVAEVSQLLYDTSENPLDLYHHLRRFGISLLFSIVGGVRVQHVNSDLCIKYFELLRMVAAISEPGNAPPVELLPILNYVPDMFVRNWKARCAMIDNKFQGILSSMVDSSEKRLKEGCPNDCFIEMMMRNRDEWDLDRETIIGITGGLALGGVVTITSLLQFMVLLAVAHPQFQRKVHEELDRVIGVDRTPTLDDMPSLPYLNAFIRETQRFRITGPLGIPHFAQEDQFYGGYLIPKGSTLIMNLWGALHDPAVFDDPDSFNPERFIRSPHGIKSGAEETISAEAMKRLETLNFGAGRRKCVGLPMAVDVLVIAAANLFWAFEFCHLVNDYGEKTEADLWAFTSGSSNDPLPFKCKTRSRSQGHVEIIKQNFADSLPLFEMFQRELPEGNGSYARKS
ncbi:hypothetical protein FRC03_011345 [Tulasnella sp. 419]|nr:hypothetical protein FRC03_011345 [Tulasnella sp. 419]